MKKLIPYITTAFFCIIQFSCSNDFLSEKPDISSLISATEIIISPEWEATDYSVHIPGSGNASFSIMKIPDWLHVSASSGQFQNDIAIIRCHASVHKDNSAIGIYKDLMLLDIEGKGKTLVPVSYITEGDPKIETENNITFQYYYPVYNDRVTTFIRNNGQGILLWGIAEKPEWLTIQTKDGIIVPGLTIFAIPPANEVYLDLIFNVESLGTDELKGHIVIASNDKSNSATVINLYGDFGNPSLFCPYSPLNFGRSEITQTLDFSNQGNGLLTWSIESCPEWLSVSETSGALFTFSWKSLTFTCNRDLLPEGRSAHIIYMKTNDKNTPSQEITVIAEKYSANPNNIKAIEGAVTDAWMDKKTDILYLSTSQPNRLLAYNTKTKTIDRELILSKAPTCFSVSEDGLHAVIGHAGLISWVNMEQFSVKKTLDVDYNLFDIEWGAGNWCCYTPGQEVQWSSLEWRNLETGEKFTMPDNSYVYGETLIKKVPRQDYIIASRLSLSPTGITIFDTQTRSFAKYFHEDIGNFWFSTDGSYLFCSSRNIYKTSAFSTSSDWTSPIGSFNPDSSWKFYWIDHHPASHSIWVLASYDSVFDLSQKTQNIYQYGDNDFIQVGIYCFDVFYKGYPAQAHYIFANSAGSEVIAIKNIVLDNNLNDWAVEHIPIIK